MPPTSKPVREDSEGVYLELRVHPKAAKDAIGGIHNGRLRVSVTAPPDKGKANAAVTELLAKKLGIAKGAVRVVHGIHSRDKCVRITGMPSMRVWKILCRV